MSRVSKLVFGLIAAVALCLVCVCIDDPKSLTTGVSTGVGLIAFGMALDPNALDNAIQATQDMGTKLNAVKNANTADSTADQALQNAQDTKKQTARDLATSVTDASEQESVLQKALDAVSIDPPAAKDPPPPPAGTGTGATS